MTIDDAAVRAATQDEGAAASWPCCAAAAIALVVWMSAFHERHVKLLVVRVQHAAVRKFLYQRIYWLESAPVLLFVTSEKERCKAFKGEDLKREHIFGVLNCHKSQKGVFHDSDRLLYIYNPRPYVTC